MKTAPTIALLIALLPSGIATALADVSLEDKAAAQVLFDEGRRLAGEGRYLDACPKFAESQRLDPGIGTQFNLADCLEHTGRTASAWAVFLEVASLAKAAGQPDREKVARQRAADLAPRVPHLTLTGPVGALPPGTMLLRDGEPTSPALWATRIPIDPGTHEVEIRVPGKEPWHSTLVAKPNGETSAVAVPTLGQLADAVGPAPQAAAPSTQGGVAPPITASAPAARASASSAPWRTVGFTLGALGLAGLGASGIVALVAKGAYRQSLSHCRADQPNLCNAEGVSERDRARTEGNVATGLLLVGAAALVAGGLVLFTSRPHESEGGARANGARPWRLTAGPTFQAGGGGIVLRGDLD